MSLWAVDFGGTRVKAGMVAGGSVDDRITLDVEPCPRLEVELPKLRDALRKLRPHFFGELSAVGLALPVTVESGARRITRTFGKYEDAPSFPFDPWFEREFGVPVIFENDAKAAALGEWKHGSGRGCRNMVMVTLGTGIGTAVISEGRLLGGSSGAAGNLGGHMNVGESERECICGARGCVETEVSTWALPSLARALPGFEQSRLASAGKIDYRAVFELAAAGDALAIKLRDRAFTLWSRLLANLVVAFDPERIVLGGGLMRSGADILPALESSLRQIWGSFPRSVELLPASLGDDAALVGLAFAADQET